MYAPIVLLMSTSNRWARRCSLWFGISATTPSAKLVASFNIKNERIGTMISHGRYTRYEKARVTRSCTLVNKYPAISLDHLEMSVRDIWGNPSFWSVLPAQWSDWLTKEAPFDT